MRWELLLILILGVLIGFLASSLRLSQNENTNSYLSTLWEKYSRMEEISYILEKEYYDESFLSWKNSAMIENATKAFVDWMWDPYTTYLDEEQFSWLQNELVWEDSIEWIGAVVWKKDYYVQVEEIVKGSPAYKAGLQPLDRIIMIWTWETQDLTVTEAVKKNKMT